MKNKIGRPRTRDFSLPKKTVLRQTFIEPPFSVLDSKTGWWQKRKNEWISKGIQSELGRDVKAYTRKKARIEKYVYMPNLKNDTSIFDPVLCELMYHWFCPEGGTVFDPFAGGSVRGVVAQSMGRPYTGIELSEKQVQSNREQADNIFSNEKPTWLVGDSDALLDSISDEYDFSLSCPPYWNLEVYSSLPEDLSNMTYDNFTVKYSSIIKKTLSKLKTGAFCVFVVSDIRDKEGNYVGLVADTIKIFMEAGAKLYNEAILLNCIGTAPLRALKYMRNKKLVKIHQNVLCFKKV